MGNIKVEELRIGNIINNYQGGILTVTKSLLGDLARFDNLSEYLYGAIITEDVLFKMGFDRSNMNKNILYKIINRFVVEVRFFNSTKNVNPEKSFKFYGETNTPICNIRNNTFYVHDLQNLYYLITREELVIED